MVSIPETEHGGGSFSIQRTKGCPEVFKKLLLALSSGDGVRGMLACLTDLVTIPCKTKILW